MEYRVIVETQKDGKKNYYVQKSFMIYFWRYLVEVRDITMYAHRKEWNTLEEAKQCIQNQVDLDYECIQRKIVKREIINKINI